jgi:TatD DNase family protein
MEIRYIDVHSHVSSPEFDNDRDAVFARMREAGVAAFTVGVDLASSQKAVALAESYENLWAVIGLHPADNRGEEFSSDAYVALVTHPKVVAVGECGLDYFRMKGDRTEDVARQKRNFEAQITFAAEHDKPLMLHCRDAHADVISMLSTAQKKYGARVRGNVHFFTGDLATARAYAALGFTISLTGVITFAREYDDVVRNMPLSSILSETDCPFAAPVPYRGKRNEPVYVREIIAAIARIRGEDEGAVSRALLMNAGRLFGVPSLAKDSSYASL